MLRKKILLVFGTRPEAIKMLPVYIELKKNDTRFDVKICLTGQHRSMLDQVMDFFGISADFDLNLMKTNQTLAGLSAAVLNGFNTILENEKPDLVLVHGDTTTSSMAALASFYNKISVGHVEAGLRTFNKYSPYPEEINRQITSRIADYHFSPTKVTAKNLFSEGIKSKNICVTGNTVIDALYLTLSSVKEKKYRNKEIEDLKKIIDSSKRMVLVTGHRRENFGEGFLNICEALKQIVTTNVNMQIIYPVHLNPNVKEPVDKILGKIPNIHLIAPVNYPAFVFLMDSSYLILTDSGGVQEEGPSLNKPVLVMRDTTERPEAVDAGAVKLVGTNVESIVSSVNNLLNNKKDYDLMANTINPYGDGTAAKQIVDYITNVK